MRLLIASFVLAGLISTSIQTTASAHEDCCPPEHTLFIQGHGEIKAVPDTLTFTATTEGTASNVADAQKKAQQAMAAIIAALKTLDKNLAKPLRLQTEQAGVYPIYDEKSKLRKIAGYRSVNRLRVTATQTTGQLGDIGSRLMDAASRAGADNLGNLSFYVDDLEGVKQKALREAVTRARQNAELMAQELGVTLSGVQSAEGNPQYNQPYMARDMMVMKAAAAPESSAPPIETGDVSVTCDVSVRFLIRSAAETMKPAGK